MEILKEANLAPLTSIKIGGIAQALAFPESFEDVRRIILEARDRDKPVFVLGGGSNTIFGNLRGFVVSLSKLRGLEIEKKGYKLSVRVLAGTPLRDIIALAIKENLNGIYKLFGFPATVGGAVAMNAGAFGVEISGFIREVTFISWEGELITLSREDLEFSYRRSPFPTAGVILSCLFELEPSATDVLEDLKRIREIRRKTQPLNVPTSGSTFKNPVGEYAGVLLERVGMKGFRMGGVAFSEKHSNFLVNLGKGTLEQVKKLLEEAKIRVYQETGILLEEEVKLIEDSGFDGWKVL